MSSITAGLMRLTDAHPSLRKMLTPALAVRRRVAIRSAQRHRAVLDRMSALLVEDPCLRLDEFDGDFYLDRRSSLFYRVMASGHYEPELTRQCIAHLDPDRDVLDIGANVGFHAVLFGKRVRAGRVLAVEPTPRALARLRRNLARNGLLDQVQIFEGVVSSAGGEAQIQTIVGQEEYSTLGAMVHPSVAGARVESLTVAATTVDQLVARFDLRPGLVKIDAEGSEHLVLAGASRLLTTWRPVILAELSDPLLRANGSSASAVVSTIERHGYRVCDPLRPAVRPGQRPYGDILCQPA